MEKSGLMKLLGSRKGVFSTFIGMAVSVIGLLCDVPPESIMQALAAVGIGHSIGQGVADHGKQ